MKLSKDKQSKDRVLAEWNSREPSSLLVKM